MQQYKTTPGQPPFSGIKRGVTGNGYFILESDKGEIQLFHPNSVELDIPFTFRVKLTTNSGYNTHYTLPAGKFVEVNDLLLSTSGHTYIVTNIDTKQVNPKGEFKGKRVITSEL